MSAIRNINIKPFEPAMMKTIHHWLNYMCKVSRIDLLAEDAIKYPLMEFIERNLSVEKGRIERNYEEFLSADFFNSDKYVDISWEDKDTEYYLELKYVKNNTKNKKQYYFNDLVRLSLALRFRGESKKQRRCFFVVCGNTKEFKEQFHGHLPQKDMQGGNAIPKKKGRKPTNPFAEWLRFNCDINDGYGYKEITYDSKAIKSPFVNFIKEYFKADNKSSTSNKVKKINREENAVYLCSFYTKYIWLSDDMNDEQSTGLWEVMLTKD